MIAAARKAGRADIADTLAKVDSTAKFVVEFDQRPSADVTDDRLDAPAFHRNIQPMLSVLKRVLHDRSGHALEVGSGTGQHIVGFAEGLPNLTWWPTDPNPNHRKSIDAWRRLSGLANIAPPFALDAADPKVRLGGPPANSLTAIVSMNVIHIAPWSVCEGIVRLAGDDLVSGGLLVLYGPFKRGHEHTAPSNANFDASLRRENPEWGVRDVQEVEVAAQARGLRLAEIVEMPANNLTLVFERR
ncbi:MAG: DUF938 domain-containing protein [Propylenella sp.]